MTLHVHPAELRAFAAQLASARRAAEDALRYVNRHGSFSWHESGAMGVLLPGHHQYLAALTGLLNHLEAVTDASEQTIGRLATEYENIDHRSAAKIDASYPTSPRPPVNPDQFDGNHPIVPPAGW